MKIAMNLPILNVDGSEVKEALIENGVRKDGEKTVLLVDLIVTSMTSTLKTDTDESGETMLKKWDLAKKAHAARADLMEISVDEAAFIKERVRKTFASTVFYANVHRIIEEAGS